MKRFDAIFAAVCLASLSGCAALQPSPTAPEINARYDVIEAYTDAYNARDVEAMAALMHDDIQWLSIDGADIAVVADGKADLVTQMTGYVASGSATTSTLEGQLADGPYLAVREIARWTGGDGAQAEQSALAVYQVEQGLVRRVWYYPATR